METNLESAQSKEDDVGTDEVGQTGEELGHGVVVATQPGESAVVDRHVEAAVGQHQVSDGGGLEERQEHG